MSTASGVPLAQYQVIDSFFGCSLTAAELGWLDTLSFDEVARMAWECAMAMRLPMDGLGGYYSNGAPWRDL